MKYYTQSDESVGGLVGRSAHFENEVVVGFVFSLVRVCVVSFLTLKDYVVALHEESSLPLI